MLGVECPLIPHENAFLDGYDRSHSVWVTMICNPGYEFDDKTTSRAVRCKQDGKWSADIGSCKRMF